MILTRFNQSLVIKDVTGLNKEVSTWLERSQRLCSKLANVYARCTGICLQTKVIAVLERKKRSQCFGRAHRAEDSSALWRLITTSRRSSTYVLHSLHIITTTVSVANAEQVHCSVTSSRATEWIHSFFYILGIITPIPAERFGLHEPLLRIIYASTTIFLEEVLH